MMTTSRPGQLANEAGISAIMPVFNGALLLPHTLPALRAMVASGAVLELIVADDGSTDESARLAAELGARVINTGGPLGPAAARNCAAQSARGGILWFVDADVIVADDAAAVLAELFAETTVVAAFGSYDDQPPATNFLSQYKNLGHHFYHQRAQREAATFWSGCGAVRAAAFVAVGGFDEQRYQQPSIEDIELGYRLRDQGGRILVSPALRAKHLKTWRLGNLLRTEIFCRAIPWSELMLARGGISDDLNVSRIERLRVILALAWFASLALSVGLVLPWWLPIAAIVLLAAANAELVALFHRRNGLAFALAGLLFHQIYYLYSTAAFSFVLARNYCRRWLGRSRAGG